MPSVERMRPLLGTFVTISVQSTLADTEMVTERAVEAAFRVMARVDQLMSFHRPNSNVGRLNRLRSGGALRVHRWTYQVLREAQLLWRWSEGSFDCNVGDALVRRGLLPGIVGSRTHRPLGTVMRLMPGCIVKLNACTQIDLGGIAKGFAVDKAIDVLRAFGLEGGSVNAGGDLRVFGNESQTVWGRHPEDPTQIQMMGSLTNGAIATSGAYFTQTRCTNKQMSAIVDTKHKRFVAMPQSISVIARTCMHADALTKIAAVKGRLPARLIRYANARIVSL